MDYTTAKIFLSDLGFTTEKIFPLLVLFLLGLFLVNKRFKSFESKHTSKIDRIEKLSLKMEEYIIRLSGVLGTKGDPSKLKLYEGNSPLTINKEGWEVLEKTFLKEGIDKNLDELFTWIDKIGVKSALDVESLSIGIISYFIQDNDAQIFKKTEDYLYNNPQYNNYEVYKVAGLYLRDKYLEKHPELLPVKE